MKERDIKPGFKPYMEFCGFTIMRGRGTYADRRHTEAGYGDVLLDEYYAVRGKSLFMYDEGLYLYTDVNWLKRDLCGYSARYNGPDPKDDRDIKGFSAFMRNIKKRGAVKKAVYGACDAATRGRGRGKNEGVK